MDVAVLNFEIEPQRQPPAQQEVLGSELSLRVGYKNRDSSVDIVTTPHAWITEESEFGFRQGKSFAPKHLTLTPPNIQWVTGKYVTTVKQLRHENGHSPPPSAEVENVWRYASIPPMPSSHEA